ncbi:hypothetical protein AK812_SmicGene32548 [Symbiodinium microadriaticum]|uniref:Uncharacterized protein n=1 Tax=Symbiodinium microadriaticum TaxID=2951 RepID=A0A1Q9CTX1_SYMMI|nr:hypothetical protein AK812_SmicGene32548 [Symbiodinium microadriaticum]
MSCTETNAEGKSVEIDLFPDLPALLAAGPQAKQSHGSPRCDAGQMALHTLKHQQAMLKMHFKLRKWLHSALLPNMSERDFEKTQEAVEASQAYLQGQLPADEADSVSSRSSESQESAPLSSPRTQRSSTLGAVSPLQSMTPGTEQVDDDHRGSTNDLLRQRSVSDMLHDRRFDANLSQRMSERFAANAESSLGNIQTCYKEALYESSHGTDEAEEILPYEVLQKRSQATFLRWASAPKAAAKPSGPRAKARGGIKHGSNWAIKARDATKEASTTSPSPKSGLAKLSPRVYRDLAGRQVAQTSSRPTSGVSGASMPSRLGGNEADAGVASDSDAATSRYTGQNSSPELTPRRRRLVTDQPDLDILEKKEAEELQTVAGEVLDRQEHHVRHSLRHKPRLVQESVDASSLVLATSSTARGRTHQHPQPGKPRSQSPKSTSPPPVPSHSVLPDLRPPLPDLRPGTMQTGLHVVAAEVDNSAGDEPNLQSAPFTLDQVGEHENVDPTTAPPTDFTEQFNMHAVMRAFSTKRQSTEDDLEDDVDGRSDDTEDAVARFLPERVRSDAIAMDSPAERVEEPPVEAEAGPGVCEGDRSADESEALDLEDEIAEMETSTAGALHSGRMHHASLENMEAESIDPGIDPQPELLHSQDFLLI